MIPPLELVGASYHIYHEPFVDRRTLLRNPVSEEVVVVEIKMYEE